ncbi:hypothetical protein AVEN_113123-1 [Araneus ventricosus]|uniref:Uncharacterized protein n=1 Tax=Araneus ventricosus TaxID=182803 RepID=A0A4Y2NYK3_ARAVE|nr:hypothetical protein AVEN_113123-1 [Araneus ventricosus]
MENKNEETQIYHVNLLKPYHQRRERINLIVSGGEEIQELETEELAIPYPVSDLNNYDFERFKGDSALEGRLSSTEINNLRKLLGRHQKVFSNEPGKTHLVEHDFELISNKPIRSKPHRTSQCQTKIIKPKLNECWILTSLKLDSRTMRRPII